MRGRAFAQSLLALALVILGGCGEDKVPTSTLRPTSNWYEGSWFTNGGDLWQVAGDGNDGTWLFTTGMDGPCEGGFHLADLPAEAASVVSVAFYVRVSCTDTIARPGTNLSYLRWNLGLNHISSPNYDHGYVADGIRQYGVTGASRPGGGSWTVSDVNGCWLEVNGFSVNVLSDEVRAHDAWASVEYAVASTGVQKRARLNVSTIRVLGRTKVGA